MRLLEDYGRWVQLCGRLRDVSTAVSGDDEGSRKTAWAEILLVTVEGDRGAAFTDVCVPKPAEGWDVAPESTSPKLEKGASRLRGGLA